VTNQPLTVRNVTIRTATVRVRTLTLNDRQVTLSVFRQLREESIFGDEQHPNHLRGAGWGWVYHCPGKGHCEMAGVRGHRHLIWQLGEELRREPFPSWPVSQIGFMVYADSIFRDLVTALEDLPQLFIAV